MIQRRLSYFPLIYHFTVFSNPFKQIYFKYILRQDPYSLEAVETLLKKFKDNIKLIKGNSNKVLKTIDMSKIDYAFIDGGHQYPTVKNDLLNVEEIIKNNGTILCDDYDLTYAPGVKKAIDEFVASNNYKVEILFNRFAKITKNWFLMQLKKQINKSNKSKTISKQMNYRVDIQI